MKKTNESLLLLYMIFATCLVTCNCIASKVFLMPFNLFGSPVSLTVGAICYPVTFLITDIIGELWGKEQSKTAVRFGFICQIISTFFVIAARYLVPADPNMQTHYVALMGQNWVFVLASLTAYLCSQHFDLIVFHGIRNKFISKYGYKNVNKGKWIWNNVGTISSQIIDSVIYVIIAFGFGFGWLFDSEMIPVMINMIIGQWVVKALIALCDTPFFYLFTSSPTLQTE